MKVWMVLLIILAVLVVALIVLFFLGKRVEKKQAAQEEQLEAAKQTVALLIIDKKRLPVKESGLPQAVIDQVPKLMRRSKLPIVKVKAGPQVLNMIADEKIFDLIPVKKEVKATVSGLYITGVKGLHAPLDPPKTKKSFRARIAEKLSGARNTLKQEEAAAAKQKAKKKK